MKKLAGLALIPFLSCAAFARISSPGNVIFSNPASLNTNAIFDSTGTFILQLTASDGVKSTTATITITVNTSVIMPKVSIGTVAGIAGNSVDLPITLSTGTTPVSSLQFDLIYPSTLTSSSVVAGIASLNAGKSVQTNPVTGGTRVIIFGLNTTTMDSGVVAIARFQMAATLGTGSQAITLAGLVASDASGTNIPMANSGGSISVTANKAPVVSLSPNQTIVLPAVNTASITGTVSDDGAPNPPGTLTFSWTVL